MKHWKYLSYVLRHKWFVFVECCCAGIPLRGILHDWSKFLPSEWFAYVDYFYGNYPSLNAVHGDMRNQISRFKEDVKKEFDLAWLYHQRRNPHHWQYWLLRKDSGEVKALQMPDVVVLEMVCDWKGAGRAQKKNRTKRMPGLVSGQQGKNAASQVHQICS